MSDKIKIEIVTPNAMVASEEADEVAAAPGAEGEFGVLPGHCFMLSALKAGKLSYKVGGDVKSLAVGGGYAEVGPDKMTVLAEAAQFAGDIDVEEAKKALSQAEQALGGMSHDDEKFAEAEAALEKAQVWLEVAQG